MRDGWRCQVPEGDSICGAPAGELDHIVPISRSGNWFDPSNLRIAYHYHRRLQGGRLGAEFSGWPNIGAANASGSAQSTRAETDTVVPASPPTRRRSLRGSNTKEKVGKIEATEIADACGVRITNMEEGERVPVFRPFDPTG